MGFPAIINGKTYTESQFLNRGYVEAFPDIINDVATVAGEVDTDSAAAVAAAATAVSAKDLAETARDAAVAAAISTDFPFGVTTGTATVYHLDLEPDRVVAAGSAFRVQFHLENGAAATFQVDSSITAPLTDTGGIALAAGQIKAGEVYIVYYDGTTESYKVVRQPKRKVALVKSVGGVSASTETVFITNKARRLYGINSILRTGTCNITYAKNGVNIGGLVNIAVDDTFTVTAVNDSSNAYIDFAIGDRLDITPSSVVAAIDLFSYLDIEDL